MKNKNNNQFRIIRRFEEYRDQYDLTARGWRHYVQKLTPRWVFFGEMVWRDYNGPFFNQASAIDAIEYEKSADLLGAEEVVELEVESK